MKNVQLTDVFGKYKGMWVTLTDSLDQVISSDKTAKNALAKAVKMGYRMPTLFKVPKENSPFLGSCVA